MGKYANFRITKGQKVFDVFNLIFLMLLCLVTFYPMWHIVCASFSTASELLSYNGTLLLPRKFTFDAYKMMFKHPLIIRSYGNAIFILVASVSASMVLTTICAYVLSRKNMLWKKALNLIVIFTMFVHGGLVARYLLVARTLKMNDSYWALILPNALSVYNMIIMRTSFEQIPDSLYEAAYLDGANHWQVLWQVVVPLSKSIFAVLVLYYSVGVWNGWFDASIYLRTRSKFPLQLILREILIANDTGQMESSVGQDQEVISETIKYATMIVATVPLLCIYPYLQKYFTKGVMIGAVKG